MFRFSCRSMLSSNWDLYHSKLYSTSLRKAKEPVSLQNGNQDSFTVQYLMNQFGFSMEKAVLASSKYLNFYKPDQPDSVISFFRTHGFTDCQIRKMVTAHPCILCSNPQNTFLPKIHFLRSKGFSEKDVATILVPSYFKRSLEKCIVPSYNFIKDFIGSEKEAILAISNEGRMLFELETHVKPNIEILVGVGMSQTAIARLMESHPSIFVSDKEKLTESVKQVQNMNVDPESCGYGLALWILTVTRKRRSTWDKRMEAYKRWGCSENEVLRSSKSCPSIMKISEERLNGIMSLFVDEIGWEASEVVKRYFMFRLSLKNRMIPRWSVYQELLSKGLVNNVNIGTMFQMKEDRFLKMFVNCYRDETPFTVRYLMNRCGFSMERAVLYSSKYVNFDKPNKPDSVISFFENHGFTDSQIRKLVTSYPRILCSKPQKTLLPKIEFFMSKGCSEEGSARIIAFIPKFFHRNLENNIVPSFNFFKDFLGSEKDAILAISSCPRILLAVESHVKPNIEILVGAGMSESAIARLMESRPSIFVSGQDKLKESIKQAQTMKMDPESCGYGLALSRKVRKLIPLQNGNQDSFTVQYLRNLFGFSLAKAILYSSKHLNFDNPDQPDSVISFLKSHGFTETQIQKVVAAEPRILSYKPQMTFLPKIQFLRSKGFSVQELARILSLRPAIFRRSLENFIVPSFNFIKDFLASEYDAILAISDCPRILLEVESHVKPNIETFLGAGMSHSAIARLMETRPSLFVSGQDKLKESVKQVQNMDTDPESFGYGLALWILVVTRRRRTTWDKRMEAYRRWGCSENDVLRSSKSCRTVMEISEQRLNGIMNLFVHEIGWEASEVVKKYFMFKLSLNKRLIPRWSVYRELLAKGLVEGKACMFTMFMMKEDLFLQKFVDRYKDEAPLLLKLYIEKQASK